MAEVFEAAMLICFGVSWPVSVYKSWKSGETGGKSLLFLCFVGFGYLAGIIGKIIYKPGYIIIIYCVNFFFVSLDIYFYIRNKRRNNNG